MQMINIYIQVTDMRQQRNASSNMLQPIPLKRKVAILQHTMKLGSLTQIGSNLNLQHQLEVTGLHHALTTLPLHKESLVDYGQDGGYQTQREKSLLHREWEVFRPPSPQPSPY